LKTAGAWIQPSWQSRVRFFAPTHGSPRLVRSHLPTRRSAPRALSSAGAIGIAQFEIGTADDHGVDPFDPYRAIPGAASLLASYVAAYRAAYANPYAIALAAYNAGPGAVAYYRGVPPYPETREYIELIYERWARIAGYERRGADFVAQR